MSQSKANAGKPSEVRNAPLPIEDHLADENSLNDLIVKSAIGTKGSATDRAQTILKAFNVRVKDPVICDAGPRHGDRVDPGYFMVAQMNKVPELAIGDGSRLTLKITGTYTETGLIGNGTYSQTDPLIGAYGSFVVNVPIGMLAKVWSGNTPILLGEGPHVIHDPLFRAEGDLFIPLASQFINHGFIHIVRVPLGKYARVIVNTKAHFLSYRVDPYAFMTPLFQFDPATGFVFQNEPYIYNGTLHLIRVPGGMVAKAWIGAKAILLEYREEPYFFDDPLFRLERVSATEPFENAMQKHIRHGFIDRLRPGVNGDLEVCAVQTDGAITFIDRFTTLDDATHAVLGFINMGLQTEIFPSRGTKDERRRENPKATPEEIQYEPMTTRDSLKVGVKLLVAYQIVDAPKMMRRLRIQNVGPHVESLAVSDMARAVQNSTSQNFLSSSPTKGAVDDGATRSIGDVVRDELAHHMEECGLSLVRFNVEEAKVLDLDLAREMAKQALVAATASAQQATIVQKTAIAKSNAELEAMARRVAQEQENLLKIAAAQSDLDSARIRAQALIIEAEAKMKAAQMEGEQYRKFPELLQLQIATLQMQAMQKVSMQIISPEIAQTPFGLSATGVGGLFGVAKQ